MMKNTKDGRITVGVCLKDQNNPFWSVEVRNGLEEAAKDVGNIRLICRSPERIGDIEGQKKIICAFIREGVDVLILAPSDPVRGIENVLLANEARIPIIIIDSNLDKKAVKQNQAEYAFVGFDDYSGGFKTGILLREKLTRGSSIAIIEGSQSGSCINRTRGFCDAMGKDFPFVKRVGANFEEDKAYKETQKVVIKSPDIRAIFCTSDNMAMGSLMALYEMNRSDVLVCGFDATHVGKLAVRKGRLLSTVNSDPQRMGRHAVKMAQALFLKKKIKRRIIFSVELYTRDQQEVFSKYIFQKRKYHVFKSLDNAREYAYQKLTHSLDCPIILGKSYLQELPERLKRLDADRYYIVTDEVVRNLYGQRLCERLVQEGFPQVHILSFPVGEMYKSFPTLNEVAQKILDCGISRRSCLIVLGGGVVGNLAGFLAGILMRGIRFVHVPTTVMAQIDSTTGGKQAVNTEHGKNMLGMYYEPEFIYIDPTFIKTLSIREYQSGIAEAVKHGLCQSERLLNFIRKDNYASLLQETISLKIATIEKDPRELGEGLVLVYGHTLGHALEIVTKHQFTHGEAISIGMVAAAEISHRLGFCKEELVERHKRILQKVGLPVCIPNSVSTSDVLNTLFYDKKERKKFVQFVLLEGNQKVKMYNGEYSVPVEPELVKQIIEKMKSSL